MGISAKDRRHLAVETAIALRVLGVHDQMGHHALAQTLHAAGIIQAMHVVRLPKQAPVFLHANTDPAEVLRATQEALVSLFGATLTVTDWSRDERIEFELGQLMFRLKQAGPASYEKPEDHKQALDGFHDRLLELRDLPGQSETPSPLPVTSTGPKPVDVEQQLRTALAASKARIAELEEQLALGRAASVQLSPAQELRLKQILKPRPAASHSNAPTAPGTLARRHQHEQGDDSQPPTPGASY